MKVLYHYCRTSSHREHERQKVVVLSYTVINSTIKYAIMWHDDIQLNKTLTRPYQRISISTATMKILLDLSKIQLKIYISAKVAIYRFQALRLMDPMSTDGQNKFSWAHDVVCLPLLLSYFFIVSMIKMKINF